MPTTPIPPARVARTYLPTGAVWDITCNRDITTGVGKLIAQDVSATTDRPGVWLQWEMLAGWPVDYGERADEAAMLAIHSFTDLASEQMLPAYVAPGDSCTRADDPGWRWHCISGHGLTLADWERRPLAEALEGFAPAVHQHAIADVTGLADALPSNGATLAKITEAGGLPLWDGDAWPGGGGTTLPTPTVGQMLICTTAGAWTALAAPSQGQLLTGMTSGTDVVPMWVMPATPWQAIVARWIERVDSVGGTYTASSVQIADDLITAMLARSWAGKVIWFAPFLGGNVPAAIVPLFDQANVGLMTNTGFVGADFSEATGITGGAGKMLNTNLLMGSQLGAGGNGSLLGWVRTVNHGGTAQGVIGDVDTGWTNYGASVSLYPTVTYAYWGPVAAEVAVTRASSAGCYHWRRSSSSNRRMFFNGASIGSATSNYTGLTTKTCKLFGDTYSGGRYSWHNLSCAMMLDGSESDAEVADIYSFLQTYLITPTGR